MNEDILHLFDSINLSYLQDKALLLNRKDLKFIFSKTVLNSVLEDCLQDYQILKINNACLFQYKSNYLDTKGLDLYFDHHRGKGNRYKIREREYIHSQLRYIELKYKTNKNQTIKVREPVSNSTDIERFISENTGFSETDLYTSLNVEYTRITLLNKTNKEKVTLDLNIKCYHKDSNAISYDNIVIAEVKSERIISFKFNEIMKKHKIRSGSLSKYCLGLISLNPKLKQNNFKMMLNQIIKANNNG